MTASLDALAALLLRHQERIPPDVAAELRGLLHSVPLPSHAASRGSATYSPDGDEPDDTRPVDRAGVDTDATAPGSLTPATRLIDRYEDLGQLGVGGMGEVRRVRDRVLNRVLAMKIVAASRMGQPGVLARFEEEAQATAQLQHPGIVPVYDFGRLPDGRCWFTMKEIRGRTLSDVIAEVHAVSRVQWETSPSGWNLRRLVSTFLSVCQAVAYAHERGVIHRDLKPENTMVGAFGEVLVLDWGLVKVLGRPARASTDEAHDEVRIDRASALATGAGALAGTPAYMSPEQARGDVDAIDARSDVYSLGAMLYELLSGRPPYTGPDGHSVVQQVRAGPPPPLVAGGEVSENGSGTDAELDRDREAPALPAALVTACARAMARDPDERFASAGELAAELQAWLDGAKRREDALAVVARAEKKGPEAAALRAQATALRAEAQALLAGMEKWRPETDKLPGWEREDRAIELERQAELLRLEEELLLHASLTHAPELAEAHASLAARYRAAHATAEGARQDTGRAEFLLRQHLAALPAAHAERKRHLDYLKGDGALTLHTDPPGVEVLLHRYEVHHRRLVPRFVRSLGPTPLHAVPLPMGSYLCELRHPERETVRYPVFIARQHHWDGVPPDGTSPAAIRLPRQGEVAPDDCVVPAGWFWSGGDPQHPSSLAGRRLWADAMVVRRFSVTNRDFMAFLDDLCARGRTDEALRYAPQERGGALGEQGGLIYGFDGKRFSIRPDADGDIWDPDWPVMMVDWYGASAFAAWEAERTGVAWRLPGELEWEKAARGVDGRFHPWGDAFDASWACIVESHVGRRLPVSVHAFPVDESPYGVRGLSGNVRDWCADVFRREGPPLTGARVATPTTAADTSLGAYRVYRGGSWFSTASNARVANRNDTDPLSRHDYLGIRIVRSLP